MDQRVMDQRLIDQRADDGLSPYRSFSRAEWARLREDTPMTLSSEEVTRLRSQHDRLDMQEIEEISSRHQPRLLQNNHVFEF